MHFHWIVYSILIAPLLGGLAVVVLTNFVNRHTINSIVLLSLVYPFVCTSLLGRLFFKNQVDCLNIPLFRWINTGKYSSVLGNFGCYIDSLAITMLILVSFITLVVSFYSMEYMKTDQDYERFFVYILFFTFAMQILVTADNLLLFFFGWEALAFVSFLLIGFYFSQDNVSSASLQAILINRLGDVGLLIGLGLTFKYTNSLNYQTIFQIAPSLKYASIHILGHSYGVLNVIGGLFFIGVMVKSAQIPFHIWLPDSMVGPTPASALIHAATMVTTGIYMVIRLSPMMHEAQEMRILILTVGASTALFFSIVAVVTDDLKRILAFSTISQLGYMVCGIGVGHYADAMLHLITHACFKALLFLAGGVVIKSLNYEQSIKKMGQLWKKLPFIYAAFLIGSLALVGMPPFAGFYSKDNLIYAVYSASQSTKSIMTLYAFYCVLAGVAITAFYVSRLVFLVFHNGAYEKQSDSTTNYNPGRIVQFSLFCLMVPSVVLGWILTHHLPLHFGLKINSSLYESLKVSTSLLELHLHKVLVILEIVGIALAWLFYIGWPHFSIIFYKKSGVLPVILKNQYGIPGVYRRIISRLLWLSARLSNFDIRLLDSQLVLGLARITQAVGHHLKKTQSGYLRNYLLKMIASTLILLFLIRMQFRV